MTNWILIIITSKYLGSIETIEFKHKYECLLVQSQIVEMRAIKEKNTKCVGVPEIKDINKRLNNL